MVDLEQLNQEDINTIYNLIFKHKQYTKSNKAEKILLNFEEEIKKFVKVMPKEYKRILEGKTLEEKPELVEVSDG